MSITLTPELEAKIAAKVESGAYPDASAVIGDALRLLDEQETKRARFLAEIELGLEQIRQGQVIPWTSTTMDEIVRESEEDERAGRPINDAVLPERWES